MKYICCMDLSVSFIIPVFNRPDEIKELLDSFYKQQTQHLFEIVIIEDGSRISCFSVVEEFIPKLNIKYLKKANTGPGDSRNYGMQHASGNFFVILDSDIILPKNYINQVLLFICTNNVHCFGGPDLAHDGFTNLQKAIDFTMTSFITTGGIRGGKKQIQTYEPRSFNMGISKEVFLKTAGFANIHPGEDPDLSIRIQKLGYKTFYLAEAGVFHKRRISWKKFINQVYKFGLVRPILMKKHPETKKVSFFFPSIFSLFLVLAVLFSLFDFYYPLVLCLVYLFVVSLVSFIKLKSITISFYVIISTLIQFSGYGFGFINSFFFIHLLNKNPRSKFPFLFFKGEKQF
ncbi:glycosyltransferase [Psychroflexus salis]|nr:glycosyltransferase [Psychroflexus salis]